MKKIEIKAPPPPKQTNHNICFICRKKIGFLGFRCKGCDCSYCKVHRLPEDHECEVDFQERGRAEMEKKNPQVSAPKIE